MNSEGAGERGDAPDTAGGPPDDASHPAAPAEPSLDPGGETASANGAQVSVELPATVEAPAAIAPPAPVECWRCRRATRAGLLCEWCGAALLGAAPGAARSVGRAEDRGVMRVLASYAVLLAISAAVGLIASATESTEDVQSLFDVNRATLILEGLWLFVILVSTRFIPRPAAVPRPAAALRTATWLAALPLLALLLAANVGYHTLLRTYLQAEWIEDGLRIETPTPVVLLVAFLTICVEPGVVEEWFFRFVALGHLRGAMGTGGAVLVSSIMFGLAHIYSPLSIPILTVVGLGFGLVRVATGSLLLPMLLHTLHNAAVLWMELRKCAEN
ncbi:MAG: hypothetical protein CHACPFDD_00139 [Phycisphaerae bacterium]|nr:hypothetical protein [Phycisphaerae bacterium]